jgi:Bacterial PH domain
LQAPAPIAPWWIRALLVVVTVVTMGILMVWLTRSREVPSARPTLLHYPPSVLVIGGLFTSLFLVFAGLSFNAPTGGLVISILFLGVALLSALPVLDYFVEAFEILPEGLKFRSLLRGSGVVPWHAIIQVSWSRLGKWFVIRLSAGRPVRVSAMLRGLPGFATTLLRVVPRHTIDEEAYKLLKATGDGNLPRLWSHGRLTSA